MKTEKIIAAILIILLTLIICSCDTNKDKAPQEVAPNGFPIVKDRITLNMWLEAGYGSREPESNEAFKAMEELTNISFNYQPESSGASHNKLSAVLSGKDLPDVLFCPGMTYLDEIKYGESDVLIPLNALIVEYAPNIKRVFEIDPDIRKSITTPDGNIYALPSQMDPYTRPFVINTKWLKKLGLEMPNDLNSFYDALNAFKYRDPNGNGKNDEIPFSGNGLSIFKNFLSNWGILYGPNGMYVYPGETMVRYACIQPETKEALEYFRRLYAEGLLDPEAFIQDSSQLGDKGQSERVGCFQAFGAFQIVGRGLHFDYDGFEPFKDTKGNKLVTNSGSVIRGRFAITSACRYPEAAMRWVDYLYSLEGSKLVWSGVESKSYRWIDKDTWDWMKPSDMSIDDFRRTQTMHPAPGTTIEFWGSLFWRQQNDAIETSVREIWSRAGKFGVDPYPVVYFLSNDFQKINATMTAVESYVNQSFIDFIIGKSDINEDWEKYISTVNSMGIQEIIDIYQRYYDGYINMDVY